MKRMLLVLLTGLSFLGYPALKEMGTNSPVVTQIEEAKEQVEDGKRAYSKICNSYESAILSFDNAVSSISSLSGL